MNKLMFMLQGMMPRFMAEAGGEGGGGETTTPPGETTTPPGETTTPPGETKPGETTTPQGETTTPPGETTTPPGETKPGETTTSPAEIKDEDFLKAFVADDETKKLYGRDDFQFSEEVAKKMLPAFRDAGINPEQASKIANAYAREQIASARDYAAKRTANIKEMNEAAFKLFPNEQDWKLIAAARDHFFKPAGKDGKGGTMLHTIARSELGSDLEFLALLKFAGEKIAADHTPANVGGAGAGHPKVSMAKALGIS